jgi:glucose-6-phosphate-specific signal transduction histidine kinase
MDSRKSLYVLLSLLALAAISAALEPESHNPLLGSLNLLLNAAVLASTYIWFVHDADERKFKRSITLGGAIVLFPIFAVPYYLFKSRPVGARGASLRWFLLICASLFTVLVVAAYATAQ